ncbi:acyltransferase family protein [Pseudomonas sp. ESBL1]|uniref:acyltransferase family protein n=1 Tax=Pseudomonas sp. ESBL1 TaxID=3077324 RepID=UPI002FC86B7A
MNKDKYIPGVDGLRAIAVLLVLFFHAGFSNLSGGYVGVDVFFVISGFLITRLIIDEYLATGRFDFGRFYYRRARRLFPAMFTTVAITMVVAILLFTPQHLKRFGGEVLYSIFSLSNFFFLSESGYFNTASDFKPLLHTWSLSVEEQFYLLWPAAMILAMKIGKRSAVTTLICVIFISSLALNLSFSDGSSVLTAPFGRAVTEWLADGASTIYFFTPMRAFEFCVGGSLIFIKKPDVSRWFYEAALALGLALIGYSALAFDETTLFPSYNALIPCLGAALIIFSCHAAPITGAIMRSKPMVFTGLISYSVYLVHWPLIVFTKYWLMRDLFLLEKVFLCFAAIAVGYALYRFVETPLRHSKSHNKKAQFGLACAALAMLTILPASTIWSSDGWKWRTAPLPPQIAKQLADSKQFHVDQYGGAGYPSRGWVNPQPGGKADIILLGDSHAKHYAKGLDELIAKPLRKSMYISSVSCIMLPGMTRRTPGVDWDTLCQDSLKKAIWVIRHSPENSTIVLSHSWDTQLPVAGVIGEKGPLRVGNTDAGYKFVAKKIEELSKAVKGRKIIVIGNVPGAGIQDIAGCYSRPSFFHIDCDSRTTVNQDKLTTKRGNAILKEEVSKIPNVLYLDPQDALCENGKCLSVKDGSALYSDALHLSKAGSVTVIKQFADKIATEANSS